MSGVDLGRAAAVERSARRPAWAFAVVVLAVVGVAAALVVGVRGLLGDPVRSTAADGTAVLAGSFAPVTCAGCVQGYIQDGARSVFVRLPDGCPSPGHDVHVEVSARPAPDLGKHAYRALACAHRG
ncbi:MAG TPA: hypothetical protein VF112_04800 [Candidatus Dormibacteraeota bacterium]